MGEILYIANGLSGQCQLTRCRCSRSARGLTLAGFVRYVGSAEGRSRRKDTGAPGACMSSQCEVCRGEPPGARTRREDSPGDGESRGRERSWCAEREGYARWKKGCGGGGSVSALGSGWRMCTT